jgi:hypothetical protein
VHNAVEQISGDERQNAGEKDCGAVNDEERSQAAQHVV